MIKLFLARLTWPLIGCLALSLSPLQAYADETAMNHITLVVHGGAGTIERTQMTSEREKEYRSGIENALHAGNQILQSGGLAAHALRTRPRRWGDDPRF